MKIAVEKEELAKIAVQRKEATGNRKYNQPNKQKQW